MLSIKNNLMAENAARHLDRSYSALGQSVERLSSGLRINRASDDAAGLAVRELMRADIAILQQGSRNAQDGISMLQTAEGAMAAIDDILIRMNELAEQASTDSYSSSQRTIINLEYAELALEITRIAQSTSFNSKDLLNSTTALTIHLGTSGTSVTVTPQVVDASTLGVSATPATREAHTHATGVASANDTYTTISAAGNTDEFHFQFGAEAAVDVASLGADGAMSLNTLVQSINTEAGYAAAFAEYDSTYAVYRLQLRAANTGAANLTVTDTNNPTTLAAANFTETTNGAAGSGNDLTTTSGAQSALTSLATAINTKDTYRAKLGYWMNRLEAAQKVLDIQSENLSTAESRISDVDVATEMAKMTRNQVLAQAGISMLSQANAMPQMALKLLG